MKRKQTFREWTEEVILYNIEEYDNNMKVLLTDKVKGCNTGIISPVMYYTECVEIFKEHFEDILDIVSEKYTITIGESYVSTDFLHPQKLVWEAIDIIAKDMLRQYEEVEYGEDN